MPAADGQGWRLAGSAKLHDFIWVSMWAHPYRHVFVLNSSYATSIRTAALTSDGRIPIY